MHIKYSDIYFYYVLKYYLIMTCSYDISFITTLYFYKILLYTLLLYIIIENVYNII